MVFQYAETRTVLSEEKYLVDALREMGYEPELHRYSHAPGLVRWRGDSPLLRSQGLNGVHCCRAASGQVARERGRRDESERHRSVGHRVDRSHPE